MAQKRALGRGIDSLLNNASDVLNGSNLATPSSNDLALEIDIEEIDTNPFQPRRTFNEEALAELAESISKIGIVQPITVRKCENNRYQIIAGERRWRASRIAGLKTIPAYIRTADDQGMLEMGLIENIQREDLNAVEIALSYQRMIEECNLTQEEISERVGKKRATISNYLRLLKLTAEVQKAIIDGQIDMGHARALITISDERKQINLLEKIVNEGLSVRKTEELVKENNEPSPEKPTKIEIKLTEREKNLKGHLTDKMGLRADIKPGAKGDGKIVIVYNNPEELEMVFEKFEKLAD